MPQGIIVILRSSLSFLSLLIMTRAMGKKLIAHLTFFEYAAGITIGSIAASISVDLSVETMPALVGLLTWSLWVIVLGLVTRYSRPLRRIIDGEPTVIIQNGRILKENLRQLNFHVDDLRMQLRQMAVFRLSDVEFALLEPNGSLSVLKKSQLQPLTPADVCIATEYKGLPVELVVEGRTVDNNLRKV
ncbi:MAG: DUF421 domain-containing protein, partial [Limnochordia bacterium]